jgi:putative membrane protein
MNTAQPQPARRLPRMPSDLGTQRTVMAADRTLMAWTRTALSMISFGFTIYKFLEAAVGKAVLAHPQSPKRVGLSLIALGTIAMVLGTASYWATLRDLQNAERFRLGRSVLWIAVIISLAGLTLFTIIVLHLF